ncbi:hypothetical protein P3T76_008287 [Phytophthora citrophthora]|uniref:Renin receptor-like C-terminal transmembrane spanning segment domain-containing protein n=1 Tax=Phytophthora citrophthora TaxID=4793 RepID=A0AAD9GKC8_9STRA|nr:hypothetical protein P3T76_008287 [Phytophthora citrophthora]
MADLALSSLGLSTGRVSSRSAIESPLQADIFTHSEAYALLLLDDVSAASLESVNAALNGAQAFHGLYPAHTADVKIPVAVAQEFGAKYSSGLYCAGSAALCASVKAETPAVTAELVQQVLSANSFLSSSDEQDVAFAKELAQVMQLTAELKQTPGKKLFLVGLSGNKKKEAQQAVTTTVTEFLAELMKNEQVVEGQIMTGTLPTAVQQTAALSRRARNRKLVTKLSNEAEEEEEEEEEEESESESESDDSSESEDESGSDELEVVDLAAASGSAWEDDNSTSKSNTTAPGALSMPDIAEFQIILWTSVLLGAVLLMAVLAMANMDAGRDSLLYAKFIADVNGRKTN